MKKMVFNKRSLTALIALSITIGAGVYLARAANEDRRSIANEVLPRVASPSDQTAPKNGQATVAQKKAAVSAYRLGESRKQKTTQGPGAADPFPEIAKTRTGLSMEDDPYGPRSRAEQEWLDRNGFPNAQQILEYQRASDLQLEQAANAGDRVAETFLNARKLGAGDSSAEGALLHAGALGNTFALDMLSSVLSGPGPLQDVVDGYAFSRVAEMRGDFTRSLARMARPEIDAFSKYEGEIRAMAYLKLIIEIQREEQGNSAVTFDPRPISGG